MAHGRAGPDIVMTIRYADMRQVRAVSNHEAYREPDGSSAIDPERSHLNKILHGPATQTEAIEAMKRDGVKPPAKQAEEPFVQMVLSASASYFRGADGEPGTWDAAKLEKWKEETMRWLKNEYGDDLAHVSLHLDEDTPHMHVLVVPTYSKKSRKPGKKRKNETDEEFEERKRAVVANGNTVRTMSRSSNEKWKRMWVRREARVSYFKSMRPLGLGYGKDHVGSGEASPERKETGRWVREQAKAVKAERAALDAEKQTVASERADIEKERHELRELRVDIERRENHLSEMGRNILDLVDGIGKAVGLRLPKQIGEKYVALKSWLDNINKPEDPFDAPSEDPLSAPPSEDPFEDAGPGSGM